MFFYRTFSIYYFVPSPSSFLLSVPGLPEEEATTWSVSEEVATTVQPEEVQATTVSIDEETTVAPEEVAVEGSEEEEGSGEENIDPTPGRVLCPQYFFACTLLFSKALRRSS